MKSLTDDSKVCNVCHHLYNKLKYKNPEFSSILTRSEHYMIVKNDDDDDDSVFFLLLFFVTCYILFKE